MGNQIKDLEAPESKTLTDVLTEVNNISKDGTRGLDRVRSILAMRMYQYNDLKLTESQVKGIAKSFADIELGSSTNLVLMCSKEKCLYRDRCALYKSKSCPEGKECLHENKVLTHSLDQYLESLEVDINNYPEMVMVNQLVEYELLEYRCNAILSLDHSNLKMTSVIGIDETGNIITKEEISHALNVKMQVFKNKMMILQELTATRKEKWKKQAALKEAKSSPVKILSSMKSHLEKLRTTEEDAKKESVLGD